MHREEKEIRRQKGLLSFMLVAALVGLGIYQSAQASQALLEWNANTEKDLAGYKLYRGNIACAQSGARTLFQTLGTVIQYQDATIPADWPIVSYELTAFDANGNESLRSGCVEKAFTIVPPLGSPAPFAATVQGTKAVVTWGAVEGATGYLLRVHESGTPYDPCSSMAYCNDAGTLSDTSVEIVVVPGKTYDAWVHAHRADGTFGPAQGLVFTVPALPDPISPPTGFRISKRIDDRTIEVAWDGDCSSGCSVQRLNQSTGVLVALGTTVGNALEVPLANAGRRLYTLNGETKAGVWASR